ncbi:MAG: DUF4129 domain-containing protein [Nocardioidaceae bacterium]
MTGAQRLTGRVSLPVVAVLALTAFSVAVLTDPSAAIPDAAAFVSVVLVAIVVIAVATGLEFRDVHPFPLGTLLLRLSPLLVATVLMLFLMALSDDGSNPPDSPPQEQQPLQGGEDVPSGDYDPSAGAFEYLAGSVLVLAVIVGLVLLLRRVRLRRRRDLAAPGTPGRAVEGGDVEEHEMERHRTVREGLRRGRGALLDEDDPRLAVIGAYVTFEGHVGTQGMVRRPAETQREYVARVLAEGRLAHSDRAPLLVELFNAARFSSDPVTPEHARAARDHIDALVGD